MTESKTSKQLEILNEIHAERVVQDKQWGGSDHDDQHTGSDWLNFISRFNSKAFRELCIENGELKDDRVEIHASYRKRLVQIAALALAAIEVYDRKNASK